MPDESEAGRPLVELRIHGVSGTPAESMLDAPIVERDAGDDDAGFWRASRALVAPTLPRRRFTREGYRWGGLTSRAGLRAAWVLLAPFALANTAAAMHVPDRPAGEQRGIARGAEGALVRLFALSLTLLLVLAAFVATVDLVGWQCGNSEACRTDHSITRFLGWSWMDTPGKRVTVTSLGPLLAVGVLWFLGRKTWQRYESYPPGPDVGELRATPFDAPSFWDGMKRTEKLRHLHIAGAFALCAGLLAYVRLTAQAGDASAFWPAVQLGCAAAVGLVVVVLVVVPATDTMDRVAARVALVAAALILVVTLAWAWFGPELDPDERYQLPGTATAVSLLFAVQVVIVLVLGVVGLVRWRSRANRERIGLLGCGTACVAAISFFIAASLSAGVILRTAEFLGKTRARAEIKNPMVTIVTPNAITWGARGAVLVAAAVALQLVIVAIWLVVTRLRRQATIAPPLTLTSSDDPGDAEVRRREREQRRKKIAAAIARARLVDQIGLIAAPAIAIALVGAATMTAFALLADFDIGPGFLHSEAKDWRVWAANAGSWMIVGATVGMLGMMSRAYRDAGLRRQIGILWDLSTFWPRTAHPLAPPCYGERTVPEFAARVAYFGFGDREFPDERFEGSSVIVAAHSQGTVIATAALLQLPDAGHVALLTYGSPLRRFYTRYFPAYFGDGTLDEQRQRLGGRWRNLYRETDPIGGPVEDPAQSPQDIDTLVETSLRRPPGDTVYPPIENHSNYTTEPSFMAALEQLESQLPP
jgi:hypothetical protein